MPCAFALRASIFSRICSNVGTSSPTVADSSLIARFICSCIFAWSSCESSRWRSLSFFCSADCVLLRPRPSRCRRSSSTRAASRCSDSTSRSSAIIRFANDSAACWYSVAFVASPLPVASSVSIERLARVGGDLRQLLLRAGEAHLRLLLVRDDVRGLLGEAAVLVLGFGDRLLELHLGVGARLEVAREPGRHVLPPAADELQHAASLLTARRRRLRRPRG